MLIRSSHSNLSSKVSDVDLIFITSHLFILYVSQWSPYNKSGLTRIFYSLILVYCWRSFSIWVNTSLALTLLSQKSCVPPPNSQKLWLPQIHKFVNVLFPLPIHSHSIIYSRIHLYQQSPCNCRCWFIFFAFWNGVSHTKILM